MKRQALLLLICLASTVLLARMDRDVTSFASMVRWENVPALVVYTLVCRLVLVAASAAGRAVSNRVHRSVAG